MNKMEKEIIEKEKEICKKLYRKNNGKCAWGECNKCGVIPLLYKLDTGRILEDKKEIEKLKKEVMNN